MFNKTKTNRQKINVAMSTLLKPKYRIQLNHLSLYIPSVIYPIRHVYKGGF